MLFGCVLLAGAPYLPTLSTHVRQALDLIELQEGQTLLELGCGDGKVLIAAAERGLNVIGYELNPLLAGVSWIRTRKYKARVTVVWGNFWTKTWPPADGIFVFLLDKYMTKLDKKIIQNYPSGSVKLVSFTFRIPGKEPQKAKKGLFLYKY